MSESLGTAVLELDADQSKLNRKLDRLPGETEKSGRRAGGTFVAGVKRAALPAAAVLGGLLLGGKKTIDAASNLGESVNAVQVTFGKAGDKILAFSGKAAHAAGLSKRAFNELVTPIGAMLQNMGMDADAAADSSINLAKRAADMASVFNVDVSEAMGAIQAGLRGEADPLERFGVGLSETAVKAKAAEMGLVGVGGELTAQQKTQARLALLFDQTNKVAGDFENTSGSLANQQRILKADFENVSASLGTALLPLATKLMGFLVAVIPHVQKFGSMLIDKLSPALGSVFGEAARKGPGMVDTFRSIWAFIRKNVIPIVVELFRILRDSFRKLREVVERNRPALERIFNRIKSALQAIATVIRVVVLPILRFLLVEVLPRLISGAIKWIDKVTGAWEKVIRFIRDKVVPRVRQAIGYVRERFQNVANTVSTIVDGIRDFIDLIRSIPQKLKDAFGWLGGKLSGIVSHLPGGDGLVSALEGGIGGGRGPGSISRSLWDELSMGNSLGLVMSSGYRPGAITSSGNPSLHGVYPSKAIDMAGSQFAMATFQRMVAGRAGVRELLGPLGGWYPGVGWTSISAALQADHRDHVHVGVYDQGGWLPPHSTTMAINRTPHWEPVGPPANAPAGDLILKIGEREFGRIARNVLAADRRRLGVESG